MGRDRHPNTEVGGAKYRGDASGAILMRMHTSSVKHIPALQNPWIEMRSVLTEEQYGDLTAF